jgi:hypothetical protein
VIYFISFLTLFGIPALGAEKSMVEDWKTYMETGTGAIVEWYSGGVVLVETK